jgi:hypothetical protein
VEDNPDSPVSPANSPVSLASPVNKATVVVSNTRKTLATPRLAVNLVLLCLALPKERRLSL